MPSAAGMPRPHALPHCPHRTTPQDDASTAALMFNDIQHRLWFNIVSRTARRSHPAVHRWAVRALAALFSREQARRLLLPDDKLLPWEAESPVTVLALERTTVMVYSVITR